MVKLLVTVLVLAACQQAAAAKDSHAGNELRRLERLIIFGVRQEIGSNRLQNRKDLCVGFGSGLAVNQKAILAELKREGLLVHSNEWCIGGSRGLSILVIAPIRKEPPEDYELTLELGDLSIQQGEHFATLLRRGTYLIRCSGAAVPELISYQETCCKKP